jgi:hypothetical protein
VRKWLRWWLGVDYIEDEIVDLDEELAGVRLDLESLVRPEVAVGGNWYERRVLELERRVLELAADDGDHVGRDVAQQLLDEVEIASRRTYMRDGPQESHKP